MSPQKLAIPSVQYLGLDDLRFDDVRLCDDDTLRACARMFMELDLIEKYHINYEVGSVYCLNCYRDDISPFLPITPNMSYDIIKYIHPIILYRCVAFEVSQIAECNVSVYFTGIMVPI